MSSNRFAELRAEMHRIECSTKQMQVSFAKNLLGEGFALIPNDYLRDDQVVVSRAVYEAAVCEAEGKTDR